MPIPGLAGLAGLPRLPRLMDPEIDLDEEEQRSILGRVAMGTLETAGNILDTPRAMAWETLRGGNPFAVANPFDREAVAARPTGWDLMKSLGIEGQEGFDWTDIPAVASEIIGDPLLYARGPLAALTPKGLAASKAAGPKTIREGVGLLKAAGEGTLEKGRTLGQVPSAIANELRSGERTLGALAVPFTDKRWNFNWGLQPEQAAKAWEAANFGKYSPVPYLRELASPIVSGVQTAWRGTGGKLLNALPQLQHDTAYYRMRDYLGIRDEIAPLVRAGMDNLEQLWGKVGEFAYMAGGEKLTDINDFVRYVGEIKAKNAAKIVTEGAMRERFQTIDVEEIKALFTQGGDAAVIDRLAKDAFDFADDLKAINAVAFDMIYSYGGRNEILADMYQQHMARHGTKIPLKGAKPHEQQFIRAAFPEANHREAVLKMPGATPMANLVSRDELFTGTNSLADEVLSGVPSARAAKKGIVQNAVVFAKDQNNYGRVMGVAGNEATIFFRNPETGATAMVNLPTKQLEAVAAGTDIEDLVPPPRTIRTKAELNAAVQAESKKFGVAVNPADDINDLRGKLLWEKYLKKEVEGQEVLGSITADQVKEIEQAWLTGTKEAIGVPAKPALSKSLAEYLAMQPDSIRIKGIFGRGVVEDAMTYQKHAAVALANLGAAHSLVDKLAFVKMGTETEKQLRGHITLAQAWKDATIPRERMINGRKAMVQEQALQDEGLKTFLRKFFASPANQAKLTQPEMVQLGKIMTSKPGEGLDAARTLAEKVLVDDRLPGVLSKYVEINGPDMRTWAGKAFDWANAQTKGWLTWPWPAFHLRNNFDSAGREFMAARADTYHVGDWWKSKMELFKLNAKDLGDSGIEAIEKNFKHGKLYLQEALGPLGATPEREFLGMGPKTEIPANLWQVLHGTKEGASAIPEAVGKMSFLTKPVGKWKNLMGRLYQYTELMARYPVFAAAIDNGKSGAQAIALANEIHYQYGKRLGGALPGSMARSTLPRIIPFWQFLSQNIPFQIRQLMNLPGGKEAQALRLFSHGREGGEGYVPGWMREQTAIRVGGEEEAAHFIRSFGLSLEQIGIPVWEKTPLGIGSPFTKRTFEKSVSQLSPLTQFPLKVLTGKDPYTGRPLKELEGPFKKMGLPPILDTVLQASPGSRFASTGMMLADERKSALQKALNFLTGVKIGTYDLPKQKTYETEAAINKLLESHPDVRQFTRSYVPASEKGTADPEAIRLLGILNALERQRAALAKKS